MNKITVNLLSLQLLEEFPVWKWDDGYDNLEPVLKWDPLPNHEGDLFMKSRFLSAEGLVFDGCLIGLESFHAFEVFIENDSYIMNFNCPEMMDETLEEIRDRLALDSFHMFPLRYETEVRFSKEGGFLSGTLTRS